MKHRKFRIALILTLLVGLLGSSIGLTAAYWAGEGSTPAYAPGAYTSDWNTYAKYFNQIDGAITDFSGTNLPDVIFPSKIGTANITAINNTVFSKTTLKDLPLTIKIAPSISRIEASAFANLIDLQTVTFADAGSQLGGCTVKQYVFANCLSLKEITCYGGSSATYMFSPNSLAGCTLTIKVKSGVTVVAGVADGEANIALSGSTESDFAAITGAFAVTFAAI